MKKIILSLAVLLTVGAATAFANNSPGTNEKAVATFKKEFSSAEFVEWSVEDEYSKVSFILGGSRTVALFNNEGELLGTVRDLLYNQLPLAVMSTMDKRFKGSPIYDIREVTNSDGTRYKFTLEEKGKKYSISVFSDGTISDIRKIRK